MQSEFKREHSSVGSEHLPYKQRVGGSNPSAPTNIQKDFQEAESLFLFGVIFQEFILFFFFYSIVLSIKLIAESGIQKGILYFRIEAQIKKSNPDVQFLKFLISFFSSGICRVIIFQSNELSTES